MEEVPLSREAAAARGEVASASRPCVVLAAPGAPGEHVPKAGEGERECRLVRGDKVDLGHEAAADASHLPLVARARGEAAARSRRRHLEEDGPRPRPESLGDAEELHD